MEIFNKLKNLAVVTLLAVGIAACDSNDKKYDYSWLRVTHAGADAPTVLVDVDGATITEEALDYGDTTGAVRYRAGDHSVTVDALLADGNSTTVLGPIANAFSKDVRYDVFAIGSVGEQTLEAFVMSSPVAFDESMVRVAVAHLTEAAPMVDVYVTAPDADINSASPLGSFSYKETLGPVEIAAGDYQIRVTLAGDKGVVFDSGALALAAGQDLVIGAVPNVQASTDSTGKSPISLLVVGESDSSLVYSASDGAELRVVHNAADAPAVDIVVNDNFAMPLVEDLAFPEFTPYVTVPADDYNVKVAVANTETVAIDADLGLDNAAVYSVLAVGTLGDSDAYALEPLVLVDSPRRVATEAKLRAIHGSTLAGPVDIYVTGEAAGIADVSPAVSGFEFKDDTGYIALPAGVYDISVTAEGTKNIALGPLTVTLDNAGIYTVLARDNATLDGAAVTLLDDFNE